MEYEVLLILQCRRLPVVRLRRTIFRWFSKFSLSYLIFKPAMDPAMDPVMEPVLEPVLEPPSIL
jgi:hypothetical protein